MYIVQYNSDIEYFSLFKVSYAPTYIIFYPTFFDHTAIFNFIVLIFFVLLFDRCLLVTFGDFVVVPMTPSDSRGYQIEIHSGPYKIILPVLDIACR